jgi:hypothetical protein
MKAVLAMLGPRRVSALEIIEKRCHVSSLARALAEDLALEARPVGRAEKRDRPRLGEHPL